MTVQLFKSRAVGVQKASPMSPHGMPAPAAPQPPSVPSLSAPRSAAEGRGRFLPGLSDAAGPVKCEGGAGPAVPKTLAAGPAIHGSPATSGPVVGLVKARQCEGCPHYFRPLHGGHGRLCMTCVMRACVAAEVSR